MKTLHLSIIVGIAITIMVTVPYVILTTPHSTGPIGAVTPDLNAMRSVSTIIIPKDSEDQSSGKNYQPDRFVVILGVNNTVRWINEADVGNTVVSDNYDDPDFANATKSESEGYTHLKLTNFLNPGKSFTYTFTKIGYFGFHSEPHPWLHGRLLVLPEHPVNLTQTVSLNDSQALGPCVIFALSCPRGPHIFTAQKFGSDIYIEKMTINGVDNYAVVNPQDYCVYPNGYSKSCTSPVDLALLRLAGVDTQVPQEDINISIKGLASSYPVGKPIDFGIEINGYGHCDFPSVLLIHDGVIVWQSKTAWVSCAFTNSRIDEKYTTRDLGGPFYLNQSGTYTVHVGYDSNSTEARFNVTSDISSQTGGYTKYADADIMSNFQSKIISKEKALQIVQDYIKENNLTINANTNQSRLQIISSLKYAQISSQGYSWLFDVDPNTGLPVGKVPLNGTDYYKKYPQWWLELEKSYLGMESKRIEGGNVVWDIDYRTCLNCISSYPMFWVDAITGKIILASDGFHRY